MPRRSSAITAADAATDDTDQDLAELAQADHTPHEHWDDLTKEKAVALLAGGASLRGAARALGVPYSTFRSFRISDDPAAKAARAEALADTISEAWSMARLALDKVATAPVRSIQEAALAFAVISDKVLLLEAHKKALAGNPEKLNASDLWAMWQAHRSAEEERLRASVDSPPLPLPAAEARE